MVQKILGSPILSVPQEKGREMTSVISHMNREDYNLCNLIPKYCTQYLYWRINKQEKPTGQSSNNWTNVHAIQILYCSNLTLSAVGFKMWSPPICQKQICWHSQRKKEIISTYKEKKMIDLLVGEDIRLSSKKIWLGRKINFKNHN